uniref:Apple domain-containing protein n=1 Tax=Nelumbo nucifera TaxID=4432 RepID=A0A822Z4H9_NELNU|nr:TPA_asm: hypothetical protein HUJ06_008537 [Nelumbo nucifera]
MGYEKITTMEECERNCERNCSCWGAVFNNDIGYCYKLGYPINTLEAVGDENRRGYFKVRAVERKPKDVGYAIGIVVLVGASLIFVGIAGFGAYKVLRRRRVKGRLGGGDIARSLHRFGFSKLSIVRDVQIVTTVVSSDQVASLSSSTTTPFEPRFATFPIRN